MHLKESAYNFIYDDLGKDQIVFYNSRTGALAVVHEDQYKQYKGFQETGQEIEDAEFLKNLLKCGYLLPAEVDEKFLIKTNMMQGRYNKNLLSLTIAPTMACNFRCIYCFEKGHYGNSLMDGETQIALMNFIKSHLDGVKNINVTWFGGEPLLGMSVIESLSEQIIALCEEKELQYQAGIITNGYLLTPENAEKLKKYNVRYAQVTVDGPKEIHNERRPTVNGQGTYDVIMNNLKSICGILHVHLRINVDIKNIELANEVVSHLKQENMLEYIHPYLGLVIPYNGTYEADKCLTNELYSKYNLYFMKKNNIPFQTTYPRPRGNHCVSDFYNGWVFDEKGYLYKCWNDIGEISKAVGNINFGENSLQSTKLISEYSSCDFFEDPKCKECKLLPVCMGGCPHSRVEGKTICHQLNFRMKDYLIEYTRTLVSTT